MDNKIIIIELAGEPKGKGRPRFVRSTGHVYTPTETRQYENALRSVAESVMGRAKPLDGPLSVTIDALFPIPQSWSRLKWQRAVRGEILPTSRPDADNLMKMLDSFNGVVWHDDRQIVTAFIRKRYSNKPALVIKIVPEDTHGILFDAHSAQEIPSLQVA